MQALCIPGINFSLIVGFQTESFDLLTILQPHKQQFSNPGVLNTSIRVVKMWKLTVPV